MLNNMRTFYKRFSAAFYQPRTELEKCLCGSASPAADNVYFRNDRHHHRRHSRFRFSLPGAEKKHAHGPDPAQIRSTTAKAHLPTTIEQLRCSPRSIRRAQIFTRAGFFAGKTWPSRRKLSRTRLPDHD